MLLTYDIHCLWQAWLLSHHDSRAEALAKFVDICGPVFHITTHDMKCFLNDNVRFKDGCGMRDGEAIERAWSSLQSRVSMALSFMSSPSRADNLAFSQFTMNAHTRSNLPVGLVSYYNRMNREAKSVRHKIATIEKERGTFNGSLATLAKELANKTNKRRGAGTRLQLKLLTRRLLGLRKRHASGGMAKRINDKLRALSRREARRISSANVAKNAAERKAAESEAADCEAADSKAARAREDVSGSAHEVTDSELDDWTARLDYHICIARQQRIQEEIDALHPPRGGLLSVYCRGPSKCNRRCASQC